MTYSASQCFRLALQSAAAAGEISISVTRRILSRSPTRSVRLVFPCGSVVTRTSGPSRSAEHQAASRRRDRFRPATPAPVTPVLRSSPPLSRHPDCAFRAGVHRVHQHYAGALEDGHRQVGHHEDVETIKSGYFAPIFVTGLSGNGKTTMIELVCANLKREFYRVNNTMNR